MAAVGGEAWALLAGFIFALHFIKQRYYNRLDPILCYQCMENFFNNLSFFLLLCSMSFYWVRAFFNVSIFSNLGKLTILSANLTMFFLLIYRGISENHFPLSNHAIKKSIILFLKNFRFSERSKNKIEFHYFFK